MRLRRHPVLVFIILWIVTRASAETAPGSEASNPFSLPAANTRQLRPARVVDDGSVPSELREPVANIEKAFSKVANLGPTEPGDVPLGRPSAVSQSQHGLPSAVSSVPIPPGFQSAQFVDNLAKERYNRRMIENGLPLPVSAVQVGSKTTVAPPQQSLQQTAPPVNPANPAKAAVIQKLTDLHKEMLGRIQYARQVAEVDEARFRARSVAKRKARRLRASEEDEEEDLDADSDGPVEADAQEIGDNEDISASLEADVKDDNDADNSVATSKAAAVDAANQEFLQELLDTLHSNGLRGSRRIRKRPSRRRKRPANTKNDYSSLFGAKDPAASLLDILRDERRATVNMAAAAEAKQMAAGRATNTQKDTPVVSAAPVTSLGPGYSLPVDTGDKASPMRMPGNPMRFTETKASAGAREDGWSPPVPGDPVQADPFGPSVNSFGPSPQQQAPQPVVVPSPMQQPMPLLQTQLQIQQQTAQLQQQLALQQSLQQQAAVIQQQQSFSQQMLAQQQAAQPQPLVNPPPLAANQVPPPPAAYFAAQQMAMQQQQADAYPPNANWQPGAHGYELQPERAGGPPPNPFIPPP